MPQKEYYISHEQLGGENNTNNKRSICNNYSLINGSLQKVSFLFVYMLSLSCAYVYIDGIHLIHIIIKRLTGLSC